MAFGKFYGYQGNPRSKGILAIAKVNAIELDIVRMVPREGFPASYYKLNKLGRIPTFEGADGFVLSEAMAIAIYIASQDESTTLLGSCKQEYASILRWMSFFNTDVQGPMGRRWRMLSNIDQFDKKALAGARKSSCDALKVVEEHLQGKQYLVAGHITVADYFCAGLLSRGFEYTLDEAWRLENPSITSWFNLVVNQTPYLEAVGKSEMIDDAGSQSLAGGTS